VLTEPNKPVKPIIPGRLPLEGQEQNPPSRTSRFLRAKNKPGKPTEPYIENLIYDRPEKEPKEGIRGMAPRKDGPGNKRWTQNESIQIDNSVPGGRLIA
jgi:hypothetical protein